MPADEEGIPEVPLATDDAGTVVPDVAIGAGTVVPEAVVGVGTVAPVAVVADAEGWVDAGISDDAVVPEVVPAEDEGGALEGVSRSDARRLAEPTVAGNTDRTARWTVSSTSCCS